MLFLYRDPLCYQTLMAAPARILLSAVAAVVVAIIVYVAWLAFYPLATPLEAHRKLSSFLLSENVATGARTATSKSVPRQLWMTHYDLESIPQHIHDGVEKYAADFDLHLLDDHGCIEFLRAHFTESVVQRFHDIPSGAHKADLFRFCALYISGGVYLDVKTVLRRDLCRLLGDAELLMTLGHHYTLEGCHIGITACSPRHPVIGVILHAMLTAPLTSVRLFYHWNCRTAYRALSRYQEATGGDGVIVLREECDGAFCGATGGKDRYGLCCVIKDDRDDSIPFHSRDPTYPWS